MRMYGPSFWGRAKSITIDQSNDYWADPRFSKMEMRVKQNFNFGKAAIR